MTYPKGQDSEQKVIKVITQRGFLDRRLNPPQVVGEELPTTSVKVFSRNKQGTIIDSNSGVTNFGSLHFSGSHYDTSPGSFGLRVIRRSVYVGSMMPDSQVIWKLRHSREGTLDMIPFTRGGTLKFRERAAIGQGEAFGGPMNPLYTFGPGTLTQYFQSMKGTARCFASLEGVVSIEKIT